MFSFAVQEVELAEVLATGLLRSAGWKVKSNSSSVLRAGNRAALIRDLAAVAVAGWRPRSEQDRGDELLIAPLLLAGAVGEHRQRPGRGGGFELAEQVRELGAGRGSCDQRVIARQAAGPRPSILVSLPAPVALGSGVI